MRAYDIIEEDDKMKTFTCRWCKKEFKSEMGNFCPQCSRFQDTPKVITGNGINLPEGMDPNVLASYYNPEMHYDEGGTVNIYFQNGEYYGDTNEFDFVRPDLKSLVDTLKKWGYTEHDYGEDLFGKVANESI